MESWLHAREPVELTVRLVEEGRVVATAKAIDMSTDGLGIERPDVVLKSGQLLTVDFTKPGYPRGISCCIPSMVVHAGPDTVGLILAYDPNFRMVSPEHRAKSSVRDDRGVNHDKPTTT